MSKFSLSLTAKLLLVNAVIVLAVGGMVAASLLFTQDIGEQLSFIINEDLVKLSNNARLGKDLGNMFAETQLFINNFIEHQGLLKQEQNRLIRFLDDRITPLTAHNEEALLKTLQLFKRDLQALFEQSEKLVGNSLSLQQDREQLELELRQLENLTQELLVSFAMEGKDVMIFAVEQVSNSIAGYRNLLLQIDVQLNASKYAYFGTEVVTRPYEKDVERLLGDLEIELIYVTAAGEQLKPAGERLLELCALYQDHVNQFYQTLPVFQQQLRAVSTSQAHVMEAMEEMNTGIGQTTASLREKVLNNIQNSRRISLALSLFILFMLLLAGISVAKMLRPIKDLAQIAEQLSQGDISYDTNALPRKNARDEIGTLSLAFHQLIVHNRKVAATAAEIAQGNLTADFTPRSGKDVLGHALLNMSNYLKEIAAIATAIGEGDLRSEIEPKTEHDILGHAFQRLKGLQQSISNIMQSADRLQDASSDLYHISEKMVASTQQSSQKAQTVSHHSRQIDENVNAVATATEEMSASIREISRNSSNIANIGDTAVERANSANTIIKDLERQSQEISEIITVITSVSQQTNLLALNATIEAARAGDFGKGFAVVANEIKQLSRETADSADDIIKKLEGIQAGTSDATEAITEVLSINTQISDISSATASGVEQQSSSTNEIADRMGEIANDSTGIASLISEVASSTQKTSEGAVGVQYAAQELASLADDLQKLIGKFKV